MTDFRHPSEFFVKYLVSLPQDEAKDDNWVRTNVAKLGYPTPTAGYIASLRAAMMADYPVMYEPANRYNRETVKYLRKHGVWSLHNPSDATKEACQLLIDIPVRKTLEQLLLGRLDHKEVAGRLNSRFRRFFTEEVITEYGHYFWNCALMRTTDWFNFFDQYDRPESARAMSIVQSGGGMALHVAGFRQELESKTMLKEMMEAVHYDFMDWKNQPRSESKTRALSTLVKAAAQIDERMSESTTAVRDHLQTFKQWNMRHAAKNIKGIEEIAPGGNFSESGAELKELPEKT
jgi:hypothetical protein